VLALLAKCTLLALLGTHSLAAALTALAAAHVLSRLWPLFIVRSLPHVGDTARSKSKPLADQISGAALAAACLWCFPALCLIHQAPAALFLGAGMAASLLAAWRMRRLFARRLGGFTGDCLGATQQVGEIAFYLGAALALGYL
jgi:adenosylcobinamide-GDP ribazoletransferase